MCCWDSSPFSSAYRLSHTLHMTSPSFSLAGARSPPSCSKRLHKIETRLNKLCECSKHQSSAMGRPFTPQGCWARNSTPSRRMVRCLAGTSTARFGGRLSGFTSLKKNKWPSSSLLRPQAKTAKVSRPPPSACINASQLNLAWLRSQRSWLSSASPRRRARNWSSFVKRCWRVMRVGSNHQLQPTCHSLRSRHAAELGRWASQQ